jgi:hypothetical protein
VHADLSIGPFRLTIGRPADPVAASSPDPITKAASPAAVSASPATFTAAPAAGIRPDPGATPPGQPTADPIRYQYPWNRNAVWTPRAGETTPFQTLRNLAKVCWEIFACKETRKEQLQSLDWDIVPRDKHTGSNEQANIARVRAFFAKPDGETPFRSWLGTAIEDVLVIDALSLYRRKTRGGAFYGLEIVDGATILPLLDARGRTPAPPSTAYRQVIWGQPIEGGDCTREQLIYRPRVNAVNSPYGMSPTEAVLLTVNAALSRRVFDLQYYAEGNVPEGFATLPDTWTPDQMTQFQEHFNSLGSGYSTERSRIKFLPASTGEKFIRFQERDHDTKFDEFLVKVACAAFAVPPSEIGFTADVNKSTAKAQQDIAYRRGVRPLCNYFKDLFDEVIAFDLGLPQLEWAWAAGESEDRLRQAEIDKIYVEIGKNSIDELRARDGEELIGMGNAIYLTDGPRFVADLISGIDDDPTTTETSGAPGAEATPAPGAEPVTAQPDAEAAHAEAATKVAAVEADLRKWRTVAVKAVKSGKTVKAFTSEAIPPALHQGISRALTAAVSPADVVAVFDAIEKRAKTVRTRAQIEKQVRQQSSAFFAAQGEALARHLRAHIQAAGDGNGEVARA